MRKQAQQVPELDLSAALLRRRRAGAPRRAATLLAALLVVGTAAILFLPRSSGVFSPPQRTGIASTRPDDPPRRSPAVSVVGGTPGGSPAPTRPLRVLLVGHELTLTGAPLALLEIATHLKEQGHHVE